MSPKIVYTDWGLGNVIDGKIYLNKALINHPRIKTKIIKHELRHINNERHVDLKEPWDWEIAGFILLHPKAWVHFVPVWFQGRKIIYSKTMLLFWLFVIFWFMLLYGVWLWIT